MEVNSENDVVVARSEALKLCRRMGATRFATQRVATVVGELARNIVSYTPGGRVEISLDESGRVLISARDKGSGISNLDEILSGGYESRTGLGLGLLGTKRLAEQFSIQTGPNGTSVEVHLKL